MNDQVKKTQHDFGEQKIPQNRPSLFSHEKKSIIMEMKRPDFHSIIVSKQKGKLCHHSFGNYETRNESTFKMIHLADRKYNFKDFDWVMINTDDRPEGKEYQGLKLYSFSSENNDYRMACPDFLFDQWPQVQIYDYEHTINKMSELGNGRWKKNVMGWRGAMSHPNRRVLESFIHKPGYDVEFINWDRTDPNKLTCRNYVSIFDHVTQWRFLIDVEGAGWSARTKLFFFSRRVLFLPERPCKEWFYPKLKPWVHYVPVKRDLSDLQENYDILVKDTKLEEYIKENALEFAMNNLRRINALQRWNELLNKRING